METEGSRAVEALVRAVKAPLKGAYWTIYGAMLKNPPVPQGPKTLLFICKGNICRSPFAERLAAKMGPLSKVKGLGTASAGLEVNGPKPSPEEAVAAAKKFGVRLKDHSSVGLTKEMMESFDMVFVMEARQFGDIRALHPGHVKKVFLLPLFDTETDRSLGPYSIYNIRDPYGRCGEDFRASFEKIRRCLDGLFKAVGNEGTVSNG